MAETDRQTAERERVRVRVRERERELRRFICIGRLTRYKTNMNEQT